MIWTLLLACEPGSPLCNYSGLCEDVEPGLPTEVLYTGAVTQGPSGPDVPLMEEGVLTFEDPQSGETIALGEQPYASSLGVWRAVLEPGIDFQLRVESEGAYPALWRGRAPEQDGLWYTGALFSWPEEVWGGFIEQLAGLEEAPLDLRTEDVVHLWGVPVDKDLATQALGPDRVVVIDGEGVEADVVLVGAGEAEEGQDAPTYFMAFNLAPGEIVVQVTGESGDVAETTYRARAGEVVSAWWFEVP